MKKPSRTKNILINRRLPRLERLLLDTDVNVELEPLLQAIGFRTEFALRVVNVRKDTDILRWARRHRYILICHDKHKDKQTQLELFPEIYHNGGKIIRIGGKPSQDIYTSLGKILLHREEWINWFKENDGIVTVHQGMTPRPAIKLYQLVQGRMNLEVTPERTLRHRERSTRPRKPIIKQPPPEQQRLN